MLSPAPCTRGCCFNSRDIRLSSEAHSTKYLNPLLAKLSYFNFHPFEGGSETQLPLGENDYLFNLGPNILLILLLLKLSFHSQ